MGDNVAAANPEKDMLRLCTVRCPHMNQITLDDTLTPCFTRNMSSMCPKKFAYAPIPPLSG